MTDTMMIIQFASKGVAAVAAFVIAFLALVWIVAVIDESIFLKGLFSIAILLMAIYGGFLWWRE